MILSLDYTISLISATHLLVWPSPGGGYENTPMATEACVPLCLKHLEVQDQVNSCF